MITKLAAKNRVSMEKLVSNYGNEVLLRVLSEAPAIFLSALVPEQKELQGVWQLVHDELTLASYLEQKFKEEQRIVEVKAQVIKFCTTLLREQPQLVTLFI